MKNLAIALTMGFCMIACKPQMQHETIHVEAPFEMGIIQVPIYPQQDFNITTYGAVPSDTIVCTEAIAQAITTCNNAGGGRVIIPAGEWLTGPIHLKSNVNLHLSEGAIVRFTDNPTDYLPARLRSSGRVRARRQARCA